MKVGAKTPAGQAISLNCADLFFFFTFCYFLLLAFLFFCVVKNQKHNFTQCKFNCNFFIIFIIIPN